jgi:hypothetical protein
VGLIPQVGTGASVLASGIAWQIGDGDAAREAAARVQEHISTEIRVTSGVQSWIDAHVDAVVLARPEVKAGLDALSAGALMDGKADTSVGVFLTAPAQIYNTTYGYSGGNSLTALAVPLEAHRVGDFMRFDGTAPPKVVK